MYADLENGSIGETRSKRYLPPAHFSLKIQSYSSLAKAQIETYDSGVFEASGHKWRLSLYPNEAKVVKGRNGYISLFLRIAETDTYPNGWEIYAHLKLFVFDHVQKKYLTVQDVDGAMSRYCAENTGFGYGKFLSLEVFKNSSNGFLVNDCCEFGVEVFVYKPNAKSESLAMFKQPSNGAFRYMMENFSALSNPSYQSKVHTIGEKNWRLEVYPNGYNSSKGKSLSVYLQYTDWKSLPAEKAVYAEFKIRVLDQVNGKHIEKSFETRFRSTTHDGSIGALKLISLENLGNKSKGFVKNDVVIVEAEILVLSEIKVYK